MSNFRLKEAVRAATPDDTIERQKSRDQIIVRTSVIGILANVMLAVFKAVIGAVTGSIAITMDAVNNLSDAGASLITIVGTKLAKRRDKVLDSDHIALVLRTPRECVFHDLAVFLGIWRHADRNNRLFFAFAAHFIFLPAFDLIVACTRDLIKCASTLPSHTGCTVYARFSPAFQEIMI